MARNKKSATVVAAPVVATETAPTTPEMGVRAKSKAAQEALAKMVVTIKSGADVEKIAAPFRITETGRISSLWIKEGVDKKGAPVKSTEAREYVVFELTHEDTSALAPAVLFRADDDVAGNEIVMLPKKEPFFKSMFAAYKHAASLAQEDNRIAYQGTKAERSAQTPEEIQAALDAAEKRRIKNAERIEKLKKQLAKAEAKANPTMKSAAQNTAKPKRGRKSKKEEIDASEDE